MSFFCKRHNIKYEDETLRGLVTGAFTLKKNNGSFQDWKIDESQKFPFLHIFYDPLLQDKDFVNIFYDFFHDVRNDYNHCGFRSKQKPLESRDIIKKIGDAISSIQQKLDSSAPLSFKEDEKPKLFLNLTNHPHLSWDKEQLDSSSKYGNIVDMAFPSIAPDDNSTAINAIVEKYSNIIKEQTDYFKKLFGYPIAVILVPRKYISYAALFWLVLLMFVILLEKRQYKYLIPFTPALTGWATVMVATPVAFSFRYVYFLFLLQPIFIYLLVTGLRQDHSSN